MPKKAKKGGGGKGGAKTEEERQLYLQQRAQAEEETAKKKEEILTLFLKDKLQKEERNTAMNLLKLNEGWRSILRQTRAGELRDDVTVLRQTLERRLDGLDSIVQNLERDLREAERQAAQASRAHLRHLERLRARQDERLQLVQRQWEDGLQRLSSGFSRNRKQMLSTSERQRAHLEDVAFSVERQHEAAMDDVHRLYSDSVAAYESARGDRRTALVLDDRKPKVKDASGETETLGLLDTNQHFTQITNAQMKKRQDAVIRLRDKLKSRRTETQQREREQTDARNQVTHRTRRLREQLSQAQTAARKRLSHLTVQSDGATKRLQAVVTKGEKVLRVAELCRRLESEQSKVSTPFPPEEAEGSGPEAEEAAKEGSEFPELRRLMWSVRAAVLRREALNQRRDDLSRENGQLRLLLRRRLDAMTLSDDALHGRSAPLAVHPAPPSADRRHTVIEAAHAVKHSL